MIGDNVEITIVSIRKNEIQLGIIAPKSVPVYRKEVYERISGEKERSSIGYPYFHARRSNSAVANT
jgi:carbon storage regulator